MYANKDLVLCQVHATFNAGAVTLQLKALTGTPPWKLPPTTTDAAAGTPTYGTPYVILTLMDTLNQAAAKIEMIRCKFSGVDIGAGVYEATSCERGFSGTTDQVWPAGSLVLAQLSAPHLDQSMEIAVMRAGQLLTHSGTGVIKWDGTNFKWSRFRALGAGRGKHWSSVGYVDISLPPATTTAVGYGGGVGNVDFTANGLAIPQNCALYYEPRIAEDQTSQNANFRLVSFGADFVVPKHWLLLAVHEYNGAVGDAVLRVATGVTMVAWREIGAGGQPAFSGTWANTGGARATAAFKKDAGERVRLKGTIGGGVINTAAFTLPAGSRPDATRSFSVDSNGAFGYITITNAGVVTPVAGATTNVSLDNIEFEAAA